MLLVNQLDPEISIQCVLTQLTKKTLETSCSLPHVWFGQCFDTIKDKCEDS